MEIVKEGKQYCRIKQICHDYDVLRCKREIEKIEVSKDCLFI